MVEDFDAYTTRTIVRKLLPFLGKKGIPITPKNYRIWFEYFVGSKKELIETLDELMEKNASFTPEMNDELYERFFVRDFEKESHEKVKREIEVVEETGRKTSELLISTIKEILTSNKTTAEYGKKLAEHTSSVSHASRLDEVRNIIETLILDTQEAHNQNTKTQKKMEFSTKELSNLHLELSKAKSEARTDNLTGLHNRRYFDEEMEKLLLTVKANSEPCSLIMLDLDRFKTFNDTYGHLVGDKLLQTVANETKEPIPEHFRVCRYGGEEFAVVCPGTPLEEAEEAARQIRKQIEEIEFTVRGTQVDVSLSAGVSQFRASDTVKAVIGRADGALYLAKGAGRNTVKTEKDLKEDAEVPDH